MDEKEFLSLLEEVLEVNPGEISLSERLSDYNWDSLSVLGFISAVDTNLDITIDAERLSKASTPADLLAIIDDTVRT